MKYIASKLSYDQEFTFYATSYGRAPAVKTGGVLVRGRQNVRDPYTLFMPTEGAITEVSDEDAERLSNDSLFKQYLKNGMMKIVSSRGDARKAAHDLNQKDGAAQLTERDFTKKGRKAPKAVKKGADEEDDGE